VLGKEVRSRLDYWQEKQGELEWALVRRQEKWPFGFEEVLEF
jgi:hypothetical protein